MKDLLRSISLLQLVWDALIYFAQNSPDGVARIDAVIGDLLDDGALNGSNQPQPDTSVLGRVGTSNLAGNVGEDQPVARQRRVHRTGEK